MQEDKKKNTRENKNKKEKKKYKKWFIIYLIVLIVGIILMNIVFCDNEGNVKIKDSIFINLGGDGGEGVEASKSKEIVPCWESKWPYCDGYCSEGECVSDKKGDIGICVCRSNITFSETDSGFDPSVAGEIIISSSVPSTSETYKEDTCISYSDLREYTLLNGLSYNVTLVDCKEFYDDVFACCKGGRCVPHCGSYDCGSFAVANGFSNWYDNRDGRLSNLGECEEFARDFCGEKPSSIMWDDSTSCCVWNCMEEVVECGDSYPSCGGVCPPDNICVSHNNKCLCVPRDFQFCEDSYPDCNGYCESGICISDGNSCYCENNPSCKDSWELGCTGYCDIGQCEKNTTSDECNCVVRGCQDSDGGLNIEQAGICVDSSEHVDYCVDNSTLGEWQCKGEVCMETLWQCNVSCMEVEGGAVCT